ncbi:hypothetical protein PTI98_004618 [Pleurotus ostreatus]|nr:hypothetical protein PTI98_004618 [Pleurotus ostreatus]
MVIPFELILALGIEGFKGVVKACRHSYFPSSDKLPFEEVPLPNLQMLRLFECTFITLLKDASRFQALKDFLKERKDLGIPIERVVVGTCPITEVAVEELKQFTEVNWDGEEVVRRRNL